jgi:hypothetical protein
MRRLILLTLVAVGALIASSIALADHGDAKSACADLNLGGQDIGYALNGVVTANIITVEPTCKNVTYNLVVIVDPGEVITTSQAGTGTTPFTISTAPITTDADNTICAFVFSSRGGKDGTKNVLDRLPNETDSPDCFTITLGGTGGGAGHA